MIEPNKLFILCYSGLSKLLLGFIALVFSQITHATEIIKCLDLAGNTVFTENSGDCNKILNRQDIK